MRKNITNHGILLLLVVALLAGCSKNEIEINQEKLIGTWISTDKNDTLYFTTNNDFYHSNGYMSYDHYDYELYNDSIEIRYRGKLFVLIHPTMHKYLISNESLTIDFSNKQCYGFELKEITYARAE